jgi:hypothetical protein
MTVGNAMRGVLGAPADRKIDYAPTGHLYNTV